MTAQVLPMQEMQFARAGAVVHSNGASKENPLQGRSREQGRYSRKASISTQASESTCHSLETGSSSDGLDDWTLGCHIVGPSTIASAANTPFDFASAWTSAASVGGWKREEPRHSARPKNQRQSKKKGNTGKPSPALKVPREEPRPAGKFVQPVAPTAFADCSNQADFAKWFAQQQVTPAQETKSAIATYMATPAASAVPRPSFKTAPPPGLPPPGVLKEQTEFWLASGHGKQDLACPLKVFMPSKHSLTDTAGPLKIHLPLPECPQAMFDPTKPCKKRLPDFVF